MLYLNALCLFIFTVDKVCQIGMKWENWNYSKVHFREVSKYEIVCWPQKKIHPIYRTTNFTLLICKMALAGYSTVMLLKEGELLPWHSIMPSVLQWLIFFEPTLSIFFFIVMKWKMTICVYLVMPRTYYGLQVYECLWIRVFMSAWLSESITELDTLM